MADTWLTIDPAAVDTTKWKTIAAASVVGKIDNYLYIPVFSYPVETGGSPAWRGASKIVVQFNGSSPKDFTILKKLIPPTSVNFCLCVRYRVGDTCYRYKLWENVGETIPGVNLYNGELIKKNFVFEIWSTASNLLVSLPAALPIQTSILQNPVSYNDASTATLTTLDSPVQETVIDSTPKTFAANEYWTTN